MLARTLLAVVMGSPRETGAGLLLFVFLEFAMPVFTWSVERSGDPADQFKGVTVGAFHITGRGMFSKEQQVVDHVADLLRLPGKYKVYLHVKGWETLKEFAVVKNWSV